MEVTIVKGPLFEEIEKKVYKKLGKIILKSISKDEESKQSA